MGRNIELKCRCPDLEAVARRARALGAEREQRLAQRDTFFVTGGARLKLRDFGDGRAELISYRRADTAEARPSDYHICAVAPALEAVLADALGVAGVVEKQRDLWIWRNTRIHLDEVSGLGCFVELETVLREQSEADARDELAQIARALALDPSDHVALPYVELLERSRAVTAQW
jgi:adenylate cyclase class IV